MDTPLHSSGLEWDKPRARHAVAAVSAVVLSVVFHGVLIARFPPLPVGSPPRVEMEQRVRPLVLGDVRPEQPAPLERPERFHARDPGLIGPETADAGALRELLDTLVPPDSVDPDVALAGEDRALAQPEPERDRAAWEPRQELMHIRERIVPDEIAALPRRIVPDMDRHAQAADIVLPAESPADALAARGEGWRRAGDGRGRVVSFDDEPDEDHEPEPEPERRDLRVPDAFEEEPEVVTEVEAIEQLLALDLATYLDPADPEHVYFRIEIRRRGAEALPVLPRDVLLIQDASASMTQEAVDRSKQGMYRWLETLREGDRFDIIAFNDSIDRAFGEPKLITPFTRSSATFFIENMRARGGTDIFASLQPLLDMDAAADRPVIAVMISDGVPTVGVVDSTEIISRFSEANAGRVSVFNVGAGRRINKYLLDFLSYKNRGDAIMPDDAAALPVAMSRMAQEVSRPVLANLRLRVAGAPEVDMYPEMLTHLYLDRPLIVYGRKPAETRGPVLHIVGRSGPEVKDMLFRLDFDEAAAGDAGIRTEWAWQRMYHLVGEHIRTRDPAVLREIRRIGATYNLPVLYGAEHAPMH